MSSTNCFDTFYEQYLRLKAFYMEVCNSPYSLAVLALSRELTIFQLMAITEVYQRDATRLVVKHNTRYLSKYRKELMKILIDKSLTSTWEQVYEQIIDGGVNSWTSGTYINWIDNMINEKLIKTPSTKRTEWLCLDEIKATRNLLAHHKGVIVNSYLERTKEFYNLSGKIAPTLGNSRLIDNQYCHDAFECCEKVISSLDVQIAKAIS